MRYIIIDGNYELNRATYKSYGLNLINPNGDPVGGTFLFMKMLMSYLELGDQIICVWDKGYSKQRLAIYPEYKANRKVKINESLMDPEELEKRRNIKNTLNYGFEYVPKILKMIGINSVKVDNHEADDICLHLASRLVRDGNEVIVVSDDSDYMQMLTVGARVYKGMKHEMWDREKFKKEYGYECEYFLYEKMLAGDKKDNIFGIKGIGPVNARRIISGMKSPCIEELLRSASIIGKSTWEKIRRDKILISMNKNLLDISLIHVDMATILKMVNEPIEVNMKEVIAEFRKQQFNSIAAKYISWLSMRI